MYHIPNQHRDLHTVTVTLLLSARLHKRHSTWELLGLNFVIWNGLKSEIVHLTHANIGHYYARADAGLAFLCLKQAYASKLNDSCQFSLLMVDWMPSWLTQATTTYCTMVLACGGRQWLTAVVLWQQDEVGSIPSAHRNRAFIRASSVCNNNYPTKQNFQRGMRVYHWDKTANTALWASLGIFWIFTAAENVFRWGRTAQSKKRLQISASGKINIPGLMFYFSSEISLRAHQSF